MPLVYGEAVLFPQCTNLCSPGCIEQHKLHYSVYPGSFVIRMNKFLLHCVGRFKVNRDIMLIEGAPEFLGCSCDIKNDDVVRFSGLLLSVCSGVQCVLPSPRKADCLL